MELPECMLCTIMHSGTIYFRNGLEKKYRVAFTHFNYKTLEQAERYQTVFTTYRDPLRVAASWANRSRFNGFQAHSLWKNQWSLYGKLLARKPNVLSLEFGQVQHGIDFGEEKVNSKPDKLGLHEALDNNDLDYFYSIVPKHLIEHANRCIKKHQPKRSA